MKFTDWKQKINAQILESMEVNGCNWIKPYHQNLVDFGVPHNAFSGRPYSGSNVWSLSFGGFTNPSFGTFKQWTSIGGNLAGEKSIPIIWFSQTKYKDKDGNEKIGGAWKVYNVFNIEQVKGYDETKLKQYKLTKNLQTIERDVLADSIVKSTKATINHNGSHAYYVPSKDEIYSPPINTYKSTNDYYSTIFHELTHWTGHKDRLDRFPKHRTTESYAFEELVAEIGSTHLCAYAELEPSYPRSDHAKYLNNWIKVIKDNDNVIVKAFTKGDRASNFILDLHEKEVSKKDVA